METYLGVSLTENKHLLVSKHAQDGTVGVHVFRDLEKTCTE